MREGGPCLQKAQQGHTIFFDNNIHYNILTEKNEFPKSKKHLEKKKKHFFSF
jgi:hypothetical protein